MSGYTLANPQRDLVWNVNFHLYPTNIFLLLDLFKSPLYAWEYLLFWSEQIFQDDLNEAGFMVEPQTIQTKPNGKNL